jgi:hypothetical protein
MTEAVPSRSHGACFTCRIRHRKCDETAPECAECTSRRIECHGYGPPPAWAKDPRRLREEVQKIKTQIKQHLRRSKAVQRPRRRSSASEPDEHGATATTPDFQTFREAELLMHYLDHIFMIQFPYYTEKGSLNSRGWLFWRLTKKGPLRQAALTLAAFHRQTLSQHGAADALERLMLFYHTSSMRELRAVVSRRQVNRSAARHDEWIEFMACGTALISFEVCRATRASSSQGCVVELTPATGLLRRCRHLDATSQRFDVVISRYPARRSGASAIGFGS